MATHQIIHDLQLGADSLIDIVAVQWHTAVPIAGGQWRAITPAETQSKTHHFAGLADWLGRECSTASDRPLFVLFPELSVPWSLRGEFARVLQGVQRPAAVIAGMEYMPWQQYEATIRALGTMPNVDTWLAGGLPNMAVNAALVVIRDNGGRIQEFLQPKQHPENNELPYLFACPNRMLFTSRAIAPGQRLNFAVRVCSDFAGRGYVERFRTESVAVCPTTRIDMTFVLQLNADQTAAQFKQATQEYFSPAVGKIETDQGALLFLNTSSDRFGKSTSFGRSQFIYKFSHRWRALMTAPPTYRFVDDAAHDHQAVVLRECGPSVYWLRYKPPYLVDRVAGGPDPVPFSGMHAFWACLDATAPICNGNPPWTFAPLPAAYHWLECEWHEYLIKMKAELPARADRGELHVQDAQALMDSLSTSIVEWRSQLSFNDAPVLTSLKTLLVGFNSDGYPLQTLEPSQWCPDAEKAARRLVDTYSQLRIAAHSAPGGKLLCQVRGVSQASVGGDTPVSFCWGGSELTAEELVAKHLADRIARGATESIARRNLLVLLSPSGTPPKAELVARFAGSSIVDGVEPAGGPRHLQPAGDVTRVTEPTLHVLYDTDLGGVIAPQQGSSVGERLNRVLVEVLR